MIIVPCQFDCMDLCSYLASYSIEDHHACGMHIGYISPVLLAMHIAIYISIVAIAIYMQLYIAIAV